MINEFLQFLKKQKLAIRFARADMLFLLTPLKTFRAVMLPARMFRQPSTYSAVDRVTAFLKDNSRSLPAVMSVPIALNYELPPLPQPQRILNGSIIFKQALDSAERKNNYRLLSELGEKDWPLLAKDNLLKIYDKNLDMRLFAAELEQLGAENAGNKGYAQVEIDWQKTSQQELVLNFPIPMTYSSELPPTARQNLADSFFRLFFLKSLLVSDWPAVAFNASGQISWLDFSLLLPVDKALQQFALKYLRQQTAPNTPSEYAVKRALDLLNIYCPDIVLAELAEKISCCPLADFQTADDDWAAQTFKDYQAWGLTGGVAAPYKASNPQDVVYLLDSRRYLQDSRFKKSSFYYWAPLLLDRKSVV